MARQLAQESPAWRGHLWALVSELLGLRRLCLYGFQRGGLMMAPGVGSFPAVLTPTCPRQAGARRASSTPRVRTCPLLVRSPAPSATMMTHGKVQRDMCIERGLSSCSQRGERAGFMKTPPTGADHRGESPRPFSVKQPRTGMRAHSKWLPV